MPVIIVHQVSSIKFQNILGHCYEGICYVFPGCSIGFKNAERTGQNSFSTRFGTPNCAERFQWAYLNEQEIFYVFVVCVYWALGCPPLKTQPSNEVSPKGCLFVTCMHAILRLMFLCRMNVVGN